MSNEPTETLLFIYGTLKRGAANHAVIADQTYLGTARTPRGFRLFVVADYPGLVRDPTDKRGVEGELWAVSPEALKRLDVFEGVPERLYRRDTISLAEPTKFRLVQTYFYIRNVRGRRPIVSGIWPTDGRLIP
ncbi:MAG: gamma-glutamylcyclotransferase [Synoicihabitans sp.]